MTTTLRQFGLEMECFNRRVGAMQQGREIETAIRAMGFPAKHQPHHHFATEYDKWQLKPDSSLNQCPAPAIEVVSRTLPATQASLDEVTKVANWLDAHGYEVDQYCGYHVHIDAADMTAYEGACVALRYNHLRQDFDSIMPPSRRAMSCTWARPLVGSDLTKVTNTILTGNRSESWSYNERYRAVNLAFISARLVDRRIEFRQHSGTLDAAKIIGWLKLLCDFVNETLAIIRGDAAPATVTGQAIVRRQRTARGSTRSVVVGTTAAPRMPNIEPGSDYDTFLNRLELNGVITTEDAREFGWMSGGTNARNSRLRVTAHWLRRHGAELLTTQRNGELAYVGVHGRSARAELFTAPAQIRRRVSVASPAVAAVVPGQQELVAKLTSTPLLQGASEESKVWFESRRTAIAAADARRAAARVRP